MPFNIFISYSSRELPLVDLIRRSLSDIEAKVFIAEHSVLPGESLPAKILDAIGRCNLFILLWSRNSKESEWVNQEIGVARANGKPILPIMLEPGLRLPALLGDLKYLSVYEKPQAALEWLRENVIGRLTKKRQDELVGWCALAVLAILALKSK